MNVAAENETDLRHYTGPDGRGWICDNCGETIKNAGDGWVQWLSLPSESGNRGARDLSLVHHFPASPRKGSREHGCNSTRSSNSERPQYSLRFKLGQLLWGGWLMHLLSLFADEKIPHGTFSR